MRFRPFLVPILITLACGSLQAQTQDEVPSPNSSPAPHGAWERPHAGWMAKKLNLSDTQKSDLKAYRQAHKTEFRAAMAGVMAAKLKLQQDINANDQGAIPSDATVLGQAAAQFAKVRALEFGYLKSILNHDQVVTWQDLQQKRQTRMQERVDKLNQPNA